MSTHFIIVDAAPEDDEPVEEGIPPTTLAELPITVARVGPSPEKALFAVSGADVFVQAADGTAIDIWQDSEGTVPIVSPLPSVNGRVTGWVQPGQHLRAKPVLPGDIAAATAWEYFWAGGQQGPAGPPGPDTEAALAPIIADVAVLKEAPLNIRDPQFGAIGDGSSPTEDTDGLLAAIALVPTTGNTRGNKIIVPPGDYRITEQLDGDDTQGLIIEGLAGRATNQPRLLYTPATGSLVTGLSSQGLTLRNLRLEYGHASYAGELLNFDHSGSGLDVFFLTVEDCWIGGAVGVSGARSLLRLNKTIISKIRGNRFIRGQVGVRGRDPDYSTTIAIEAQNEFNLLDVAGIYNPGEGWTIDSATFEPTVGGASGAISTDLVSHAQGLKITGCWFGDVSTGAETWVKLKALGVLIAGNRMADPGPGAGSTHIALHQCEGVSIIGNRLEDGTNGIDFATSPCVGVQVAGNDFGAGVTNPIANIANAQLYAIFGNDGYAANSLGGPLSVGGYLSFSAGIDASLVPNFAVFRDEDDNLMKVKDNSGNLIVIS